MLVSLTESSRQHVPSCIFLESNAPESSQLFFTLTYKVIDMKYNFYVSENKNIPSGTFVYDFFGSGEIYMNPESPDDIIYGVKNEFKKFFSSNFVLEDGYLNKYPSNFTEYQTNLGIVFSATSPSSTLDNTQYCWMMRISDVFCVSKDPTLLGSNIDIGKPICSYYSSFTNGEDNKISPHYQFANHLPGLKTCSNALFNNGTSVALCNFREYDQPQCVGYSFEQEIITSVSVRPINTDKELVFDLVHFKDYRNNSVFTIQNTTEDIVINNIIAPKEYSFDESVKEVTSIFQEYLSCYTDHSQQDVEKADLPKEEIIKKSFIESLVEV